MGVFPSTQMYGVTRGGTIVDIEERYGPDNDVLWCRKRHPSGVCQTFCVRGMIFNFRY